MRMLPLILTLLAATCFQRGAMEGEGFEIPSYGPNEDVVRHLGYTASYNHRTLVPDWVAWELTAEEARGNAGGQYSFSRDPMVAFPKASREEYANSGWDKGHMAPRADMRWSAKALEESYYFTNVCPQDHEMNGSAWRKIEEMCRRCAGRYGRVYIVCGPLFTNHRHGTIGEAGVMVPDAFFKAVAVPAKDGVHAVGFIVDNSPQSRSPHHYAVAVDSVETLVGRDLFPQCPEEAERSFDWQFWNE